MGVPSALSPLYRANEKSPPASSPPVKRFFALSVTEVPFGWYVFAKVFELSSLVTCGVAVSVPVPSSATVTL